MQPRLQQAWHVEADGVGLAWLRFLEELIDAKDAGGNFLRVTRVLVQTMDNRWVVDATAAGAAIDPSRHLLSGDVKAVT